MRLAAWSVLVYALVVAVGGIFGYIHSHSSASLFASVPFSLALLACTPGLFRSKRPALIISLILVFVLDAFFTYRFSQSFKWMPAGMMVVASLFTISAIVYGVRKSGSCSTSRKSS